MFGQEELDGGRQGLPLRAQGRQTNLQDVQSEEQIPRKVPPLIMASRSRLVATMMRTSVASRSRLVATMMRRSTDRSRGAERRYSQSWESIERPIPQLRNRIGLNRC